MVIGEHGLDDAATAMLGGWLTVGYLIRETSQSGDLDTHGGSGDCWA